MTRSPREARIVSFAGRTRRRGGGQLRRRPCFAEPAVLPRIAKKERYERFVDIVREVGLRHHASIFGRYELMKEWADASNDGFRAMLAADAFHMSDQGYACLGRILSDEIVDAAQRPALTPEIQ